MRRKRFRNGNGKSNGSIATKALKIATANKNKLKNLQHELKFIDTDQAAQLVVSDVGIFILLNGVPTGDTNNEREGRKTLLKKLRLNYELIHNPARSTSNIRMMIIKDTMNNGSGLPVTTDLLNSADISAQITANNIPQYKVMWDKLHELSNAFKPCMVRRKFKKFSIPVWHNTNTGNDDSIQKNAVFLFLISDVPAGDSPPTIIFRNRIRFIDN